MLDRSPELRRAAEGDCLRHEYEERQKQLETAVVKRDGLVIRRADIFKASAPHEDGRHPNFTTTTIGYPQIDDPHDARENADGEDRRRVADDDLGDALQL